VKRRRFNYLGEMKACLQSRKSIYGKRCRFNHSTENTRLNCMRSMCLDVSGCGVLLLGSLQNPLQPLAHMIYEKRNR